MMNMRHEADSRGQLANLYFLLGELAASESHAHLALQMHEPFDLRGTLFDCNTLSEIAAVRGDSAAAAEWARKRDELRAQLERGTGGGGGIPAEMLRAIEAPTVVCSRAGFRGEPLDPAHEENLAHLDEYPAPYPDFAASLRRLAAGEIPSIPAGLPQELHDLLTQITNEITA